MKPRGRPRLAPHDTSINVHFRLTSKQFDATQQLARAARLSQPEWFRRLVTRACPPAKGPV